MSLKLILPFPPSVNRLWRASKGGKVYRSDKYTDWRNHARWALVEQRKGQKITGPYTMILEAVRPDKRQRDLGNLEKAVSDVLQESGAVENDYLCQEMTLRWVDSGPECLIILEAYKKDQK